ncbi:ER lumen protein retaining receptor [Neoconidiobolus thromboides FSU 785]|nr:ER lumen protein retaining receptor [Neoconidiobolus thromboides FSU 785]
MNIFRLLGDMLHLASILILLLKITQTNSCSGISLKSQVLYLAVFGTRYLNLFWYYGSLYLVVMRLFFIASSAYVVYLMQYKLKPTYNKGDDLFRAEYLAVGAAILALLFHEKFEVYEIIWTFSIYLEAVAIFPQLFMLTRKGEAENITTHYLFALGAYRGLYIINWIYRYNTENIFHPYTVIAGIVQTALYADFFYIYVTKVMYGQKFRLPV